MRPMLKLADGSSLSVQASSGHYSCPRSDNERVYEAVEVGFPQNADGTPWSPEALAPYLEPYSKTADNAGVFAWVPLEVLEAVCAERGGVAGLVH